MAVKRFRRPFYLSSLTFFAAVFLGTQNARADISGLWTCQFGLGSSSTGYPQDMNLFDSGGVVTGQEFATGTSKPFANITGSSSGNSFSITAQYISISYFAKIDGTVSGSSMTGSWHNNSQSGLLACSRSGGPVGPSGKPTPSPTPGKRKSACKLFCNRTGLGGFTVDGLNTADCYVTVADGRSNASGLIPSGVVNFAATDGFLPAAGQCPLVRGPQSASCNFQLSIPSVPPFPIGVRFPIGIEYPGDATFEGCTDGHHLLVLGCFDSESNPNSCSNSVSVNSKNKTKIDAKGVIEALVECGGDKPTPSPAEKQELCIVDGHYSTTLPLTLQGLTGAQFLKLGAAITARDLVKFPALKFIKDANKKYNEGELTLILSSLSDINKLLKGKRTSIEAGGSPLMLEARSGGSSNSRRRPVVTTFTVGKLSAKVPVGTIVEKSIKATKDARQLFAILRRGGITDVPVTAKFTARRTDALNKKLKSTTVFELSLN